MRSARRRTVSDVWLCFSGVMLSLAIFAWKDLYLPVTGRGFLLTGQKDPNQTGHNDCEVRKGRSPGRFVLLSLIDAISPFVCPISHKYVN